MVHSVRDGIQILGLWSRACCGGLHTRGGGAAAAGLRGRAAQLTPHFVSVTTTHTNVGVPVPRACRVGACGARMMTHVSN